MEQPSYGILIHGVSDPTLFIIQRTTASAFLSLLGLNTAIIQEKLGSHDEMMDRIVRRMYLLYGNNPHLLDAIKGTLRRYKLLSVGLEVGLNERFFTGEYEQMYGISLKTRGNIPIISTTKEQPIISTVEQLCRYLVPGRKTSRSSIMRNFNIKRDTLNEYIIIIRKMYFPKFIIVSGDESLVVLNEEDTILFLTSTDGILSNNEQRTPNKSKMALGWILQRGKYTGEFVLREVIQYLEWLGFTINKSDNLLLSIKTIFEKLGYTLEYGNDKKWHYSKNRA